MSAVLVTSGDAGPGIGENGDAAGSVIGGIAISGERIRCRSCIAVFGEWIRQASSIADPKSPPRPLR